MKRPVNFVQKEDGDTVELPQDRPFRFACCDCSLVHDPHTRVDDDGRAFITVYRNEPVTQELRAEDALFTGDGDVVIDDSGHVLFQILGDVGSDAAAHHELFTDSAPARKANPMTRRERRRLRDENSPFDENGVLKDGRSVRISMMDAEAARAGRRGADLVTGTDKVAEAIEETKRAMQRDGSQISDAELRMHRPGYRMLDGNGESDDDPRRRRRKTVERDPVGRERATFEEDALAGLTPGEAARALWMHDMQNAWRTPPVADAGVGYSNSDPPGTGMPTRAIPTMPAGAYPLNAGEGNPCSKDGAPGKLVRQGGYLVCEVTPLGATRSVRSAGDSVPPQMSAADAAKINDAAYQEYVDEIRNAWRG